GGAPVRGAVFVALPARFDRRAAAATPTAGAVVDEAAPAAGLDGCGHQPVRALQHGAELVVGRLGDGTPRRDAGLPEGLRFPDVPDSRYDAHNRGWNGIRLARQN